MHWSDEAIVLACRAHGETASIVELFTREHGRHAALVHGGQSRKRRPILQIGNHVDAAWKARLSEQLGHAAIELRRGYASLAMDDALALAGLTSLCTLARLLPERDPHPNLFEVSLFVLGYIGDTTVWPALYVRWEEALLNELGFGLDLSCCAATGTRDDLVYVSPRSGRAVSASAGAPYHDRLMRLPPFLARSRSGDVPAGDVTAGLELTGHFLEQRVLAPRDQPMPPARLRLASALAARIGRGQSESLSVARTSTLTAPSGPERST